MQFQFANRASSRLATPLAVDGDTIQVLVGHGERFPGGVSPNTPIQLALVSVEGTSEFVQGTYRVGDQIHILRGQEGTAPLAFASGSLVELRLTAEVMRSFLTSGGGALTGDLTTQGHNIIASSILGAPFIDFIKTHGTYPPDGNFAGAVEFLNGGIQPRVNGYSILTTWLLQNAVFMWWGQPSQLPPWLKLCDGSNNTPNLIDRFPLGTNGEGSVGQTGGLFRLTTTTVEDHDHFGVTGTTALGNFNLPGLSGVGPTITTTRFGMKLEAFAAGTADTFKQMVSTVTGSGGNVAYSGAPGHAHQIFPHGRHSHEADLVPPFCRLLFVMFRSLQIN